IKNRGVVIRHEIQHFIHEVVFNLFSQIESSSVYNKNFPNLSKSLLNKDDQAKNLRKGLSFIKDELLAFLRNGEGSSLIDMIMREGSYPHLKKPFSGDQLEDLKDLMEQLRMVLDGTLELFDTPKKRALFVYLLI